MDFYERCIDKLQDLTDQISGSRLELLKHTGGISSRPAYPAIASSLDTAGTDSDELLKTMRAVLATLDPTLTDIDKLSGAKDTFIIRRRLPW